METGGGVEPRPENGVIGTLAGGVAHDLNNLSSGITTYPELLLINLPEDSELRGPPKTIRSTGENRSGPADPFETGNDALRDRGSSEGGVRLPGEP